MKRNVRLVAASLIGALALAALREQRREQERQRRRHHVHDEGVDDVVDLRAGRERDAAARRHVARQGRSPAPTARCSTSTSPTAPPR